MISETMVSRDRGWSWVIALAACFNSLVLAGIFRTGGVLFVAFIDAFGVTREEASWPMVICITVLNLTGPFSGILGQKYGVRPVVIVGAVIGCVGVSACFLTTSLDVITILFGGVFGFGYGLVNTLMPVIVNAYFLNLRGLANGIANSGSCFGSVILPVLFEFLIDHFGLTGCFLLTGGIVLNVAVAGALLRPPPSWQTTENETSLNVLSSTNKPLIKECNAPRDNNNSEQLHSNSQDSFHVELVERLRNRNNHAEDPPCVFSTASSLDIKKNEQYQNELLRAQKEFQESLNDFQSAVMSILETSQSEEVLNKLDNNDDVTTSELTDSCPARHSFSISSGKRPKINKSSVLRPLEKSNLKFENTSGDLQPEIFDKLNSVPTMEDIQEESVEEKNVFRSFQVVLSSPMFYVTALTNVSFYFLFHMYVVIIVDFALDCGLPLDSTKYVIFAFSGADLIGRLCFGWITDRQYISRSQFVMICMAAIGMVFFIFPFATGYWSLIFASAGYGLLLGCTMIVFPILLVDYLGQEVHAVAYGCLCFLNGFASIARPLLIGYFRDSIGSYAYIFYILGIISILAASAWLLERCFFKKPLRSHH
ncbi:monocarboxylate transporter 9 [Parasteatoda tepidariorum]|uniref:monocarboxylate transporter 9 n=1 Tax=Parasteatoda tepidariorum TaxID=114398 RepID=UPI00077FB27B|nr:monocarboxylate transporter 12-B [Parasteatoda tepidariorum]XP_015926953.1 monocarboxylate transporter 12-B [Parasteatoda tepidariorum]